MGARANSTHYSTIKQLFRNVLVIVSQFNSVLNFNHVTSYKCKCCNSQTCRTVFGAFIVRIKRREMPGITRRLNFKIKNDEILPSLLPFVKHNDYKILARLCNAVIIEFREPLELLLQN